MKIDTIDHCACVLCNNLSKMLTSCTLWVKKLHQFIFAITLSNLFISPIAVAYSMGQVIKSVCICQSVYMSVCEHSRSHFLIDFHLNWHGRKNTKKEERVR